MVAIFYAIFALPTMLWVRDSSERVKREDSYIVIAFTRLKDTLLNLKSYREIIKFLISFLMYNDGITVVISFAAIYGTTRFGMSAKEMIFYFILAQPASFFGALLFGYLFDKIGAKKA